MIGSLKRLVEEQRFTEAVAYFHAHFPDERDANVLIKLDSYLGKVPDELFHQLGYLSPRIAVLGGYNTQYLSPVLRACLCQRRIRPQYFEGEYGALEHSIYARDAHLTEFAPHIVYFCVGTEHIRFDDFDAEVARWVNLWAATHELLTCAIVQNALVEPRCRTFGNYDFKHLASKATFVRRLNLALAAAAPNFVHFADIDYLSAMHGRKNWFDERLYDISKTPVSFDHLSTYAACVAQVCAASLGMSKKCIVLDLDNTLWGGVIGDDGLGAIQIGADSGAGEGYKRFQSYLQELKARGVLLAVCSQNDLDVAIEPFEKHPEMVLRLADISAFVANWEPKHLNIMRIADQLHLGTESLVFVDDNPAERALVRANLPEVTVLDLPPDPADYASTLSDSGLFDVVALTAEDLARTSQYQANAARAAELHKCSNQSDYLKGLTMYAAIAAFDAVNLSRITQLTNKTNQFNLTTRRYTAAQLQAVADDPTAVTRYVRLRDRFGDYGLISVVFGHCRSNGDFLIDTWVMSCRVLNRGVEGLLLRHLVTVLQELRIRRLIGEYIPTKRNALCQDLYKRFGFEPLGVGADGATRWSLDLANDAAVAGILDRETFITTLPNEDTP